MSALLPAIVALPALAGAVCALVGARLGDRAGMVGAAGAALALCLAVLVGVHVAAAGPVSLVIAGPHGVARAGLFADRLSAVMLLLVLGVSALVQLFSSRYLSGDPRQARLAAWLGFTTAAVSALVCAVTLSGLVVAWLASGIGLLGLLAHRADLPAARLAVRRAATAFAVGDLALLAGAATVWATVGDLDLRRLAIELPALARHPLVAGVTPGGLLALLLVVAAVGRSAQLPLQRWLPASVAAPTPVSAFLHAGLVNAGGFLLVRLAPVFGMSALATAVAFTAGAASALYGTALMLVRPDVKGSLAHSTMGQMGFMVMAAALGVPGAVVFHLVGHGMYKAALFLGADSVIHNSKRRATVARPAPAGVSLPRSARLLLAAVVPAGALAASIAIFAGPALAHPGAFVLIAFAWATAATAGWRWLGAAPGVPAAGLLALAAACAAYAGLVAGASAFLDPAIGSLPHPVSPWLGLVPVVVGASLALGARRERLYGALYVRALDAGHVAEPGPSPVRRRRPTHTVSVLLPVLVPGEQSA